MDDRELLELAAKAAGIVVQWKEDGRSFQVVRGLPFTWNPLGDDGDAFRLAVKLDLLCDTGLTSCLMMDSQTADPGASARRTFVEAAASIGRAMEVTSA